MKRKFVIVLIALCLAIVTAFALSACGDSGNTGNPGSTGGNTVGQAQERVELKAEQIYTKVNPSVAFLLMKQQSTYASGSGFFIDGKGTLVTNYHVIKDAYSGAIQLCDGKTAKIEKVIGYDEDLDVAILQTDAKNTVPITRSPEQPQIGETVYAIGYPKAFDLGISSSTFTTGMVSMNRSLNGYTYIQSTVDITHGNSGGVLINKYGEVVGITTAGLNFGDIDYMNLSIPIQRIDTVGRNVNETLEVTTRRHYPVCVTYMSDGYQFTKQTLKYESRTTEPTPPSKTGYNFAGWYKDSNFTSKFDFNSLILYNTTLYAKFDIINYNVNYTLNGGRFSSEPPYTLTINDCGKALPTPTRIGGYLFEGWKDPSGKFIDNFPNRDNLKNLSLSASWIQRAEGLVIENGSVTGYKGTSTSVVIPPSFRGAKVANIGYGAFRGCNKLTNITIPDSVTSIGNYAFEGCTGLTDITIPNSVTSIGSSAFKDCPIENATLPISAVSDVPKSSLKTVVLTSGESIQDHAFYNCSSLMIVTIPSSVTSIDNYAFGGCTGLTSITIPDSVTSIGNHAFSDCTGLTSVTIPHSVTSVGKYAFKGCIGLKTIYCRASSQPSGWNSGWKSGCEGNVVWGYTGE